MAAEHKERVGARIRAAREAKGWSQRELAIKLPGRVDGPSVSRWERGITYPEQYIDHLATVLDQDISYFLAPEPQSGSADLLGALGTEESRVEALLSQQNANLARQTEILEELRAAVAELRSEQAAQRTDQETQRSETALLAKAMGELAKELAANRQGRRTRGQGR